jgi:hypothetical protein
MSVKPNTTNYKAATDAKVDAAIADVEEKTVPAQNNGEKKLAAAVHSAVAADTMIDALATVEDRLAEGVTVRVQVDKDGKVELHVVEDSKGKKLLDGAKGVFNRNKKLVLATAGLLTASVVLKVIANRQTELEADEVVETSDEVSTEA